MGCDSPFGAKFYEEDNNDDALRSPDHDEQDQAEPAALHLRAARPRRERAVLGASDPTGAGTGGSP